MKKILFCLLVFVFACQANAESVPDGSVFSAFRVTYGESLLTDWQTVEYFESSGLLFSAYTNDAEISLSIDESVGAKTSVEYLTAHKANVSRYGRITASGEIETWENPWGASGASLQYSFMYSSGGINDDTYNVCVYATPISANYYIVISVNCWGVNAAETIEMFANAFVPSVQIDTVKVSTQFQAYLKRVESRTDGLYAVLDFCTVEYDESIFTVYTANDDADEYIYRISDSAVMWLPDMQGALYSAKKTEPSLETLERLIADYYAQKNTHGIYQVLFSEQNEIIWLMHFNAF